MLVVLYPLFNSFIIHSILSSSSSFILLLLLLSPSFFSFHISSSSISFLLLPLSIYFFLLISSSHFVLLLLLLLSSLFLFRSLFSPVSSSYHTFLLHLSFTPRNSSLRFLLSSFILPPTPPSSLYDTLPSSSLSTQPLHISSPTT